MQGLTIGKVSRAAGIGVETVRFYEKEGLIDPPQRSDANYRLYPEETIDRLRFIRRAKELGFTLREIGELLSLRGNPHASRNDVKLQIEAKIEDISKKIADLRKIRSTLETLDACCDGQGSTEACPILKALEGGNDPTT